MLNREIEELKELKIKYDSAFHSYREKEGYCGPLKGYLGGVEYAGKRILGTDQANQCIYDILVGEKPAMIGRFGANELHATISGLTEEYPILNPFKMRKKNQEFWGMYYGAGFFPKNANRIPRFAKLMYDSCKQLDVLACWYNKYEDFMVENVCDEQIQLCRLRALEPWNSCGIPWTKALKNKRVLVIHPFVETMKKQYEKREILFENKDYLPEMNIDYLKAVQTGAGEREKRFKDWFYAYEYMEEEIKKREFEIALIGCGAYGFPLAAEIKKMGRKAVHLGSLTQLLFGILGNRWDNDYIVKDYINEYWVRPDENERPKLFMKIEGGCYW